MHHVRNGEVREWSEFPLYTKAKEFKLQFSSRINPSDQALALQQYDVKQNWQVLLNGRSIGSLIQDEKALVTYLSIPAQTLIDGLNELHIKCDDAVDDIQVGNIVLHTRPLSKVLAEATVEIEVFEDNTDTFTPARITIINSNGVLQTITSSLDKNLAIRTGFVYTASGKAMLSLPSGAYKIYAGRGFEYGIDSVQIEIKPGDHISKTLRIKREVATEGWVSSDTHIHTFTHSGHGDATTEERAITVAGEGIELPVMTDHNVYVDLTAAAKTTNVIKYFTPVTGDELTTKVGHFNLFPTTVGALVIDHNASDWDAVAKNIGKKSKVIILNHARDIHNGFRPFDTTRHLSSVGTGKDDWAFPANAMEVINSGSQQTEIMNLYQDWFGMLNRGYFLTPAGSSDSHDVSRFIVGQGRTYIQSNDSDVANIDVNTAVQNFLNGKVMVSLGLMTKIVVNDKYGPGDIIQPANTLSVNVEVWGPGWTKTDYVALYANGKKIKEQKISQKTDAGLKWKNTWTIPFPNQDIFLVAIAEGPGNGMPYWPIAKPYQPASTAWTPRLIGSTGAVWVDGDKNGKRNSAYDYAVAIIQSSSGSLDQMIKKLDSHDEAVATQVAALLWKKGVSLTSSKVIVALKDASAATKAGFEKVVQESTSIRE